MSRTACVWIPQFELRSRLREAGDALLGQPVILADVGSLSARVIDASAEAQAFGVRRQMPMTRARALCPEAALIPPDPAFLRAQRDTLLRRLYAFSPLVGRDGQEAFFLTLEGLGRLHPDEAVLAASLADVAAELELPAAVAIADTPVSAWIMARAASFAVASSAGRRSAAGREAPARTLEVIPRGEDRATLARLPLEALPLSEELLRLCRVLGLDSVGALAALPAGALLRRFGREGETLEARARAHSRDLFHVEIPIEVESAELHLDQPTDDFEVLLFLHKNVLDRLLRQVAATRRSVAALEATLVLADSERSRIVHVIRPARPTLEGRLLLDLLILWLGSAPASDLVDSIELRAVEVAIAHARQLRLFEKREDLADDALRVATSRLVAAFGRDAVLQPALADRHRPEARLTWRPAQSEAASEKGDEGRGVRVSPTSSTSKKKPRGWVEKRDPAALDALLATVVDPAELSSGDDFRSHATEAADFHGQPVLELFDPPQPLELTSTALRWRQRWQRIVSRAGPQRLEGEWWDEGFRRVYELVTVADGSQLWIFHDANGAFLQATLD